MVCVAGCIESMTIILKDVEIFYLILAYNRANHKQLS